jgi:2-haloacid dehalogenase
MQNYVDFATCTRQALDYTCDELGHPLSQEQRDELMTCYRRLPAFPEVSAGLSRLQQAGHRMFAFSNGTVARVRELLEHAGIEDFFIDVISVDEIRSFKPAPAVYAHFLRASNTTGGSAWLVSGNPFDITGAISCGMHGAWVKRTPEALFDPWEITPTVTVSRIDELPDALAR